MVSRNTEESKLLAPVIGIATVSTKVRAPHAYPETAQAPAHRESAGLDDTENTVSLPILR